MNKFSLSSSMAGALLVASLATPADALTSRAWVSGHGTDAAGCGPVTSPCRTPQYVLDNIIAPGGEIDILDPAGYGTLTISHAVSIVNDGVGTAGFIQTSSGQNVVTINAGPSDSITLRGLNINGSAVATFGVAFNSGASLQIEKCVVGDVFSVGILIAPNSTSNFAITDTIVANNNSFIGTGIQVSPSASTTGTIARLTATNNNDNGISISAGPPSTTVFVSMVDGVVSGSAFGVEVAAALNTGTVTLTLQNVTVSGNTVGLWSASGGVDNAFIVLSYSPVTGNGTGALFQGGVIYTLGNNTFSDNGTNVSGFPGESLTPLSPQ
jgi:hypothetical protein